MFWNVTGELQRPKYITMGSYRPYLVLNTALCWSPSLMCTLLKPPSMSNLVKMNPSHTSAISSGMRGSGYQLQTVHLFTPLQSCTGCCVLSAFQRKKKGDAIGNIDSLTYPFSSSSLSHFNSASSSLGGNEYSLQSRVSGASGFSVIAWSHGQDKGNFFDSTASKILACL